MSSNGEGKSIAQELKTQALVLGGLVTLMWGLELIDLIFLRNQLNNYGIRPHSLIGLRGILFAPFLHGGLPHLIGNTIPFLILGWLIMLRQTSDFFVVSIISALVSGLGTWIFGFPGTVHIGASGVVFGYLGYLLSRGYFERSGLSVFLSLFVGTLYGSLIWGILPLNPYISWQGHLFGFLGGIVAARLMVRDRKSSSVR
jgi:membrane associated rhomboid family serine protease